MNKIHKFSMAIVAVVMIVGFSAFKASESVQTYYTFYYDAPNVPEPFAEMEVKNLDNWVRGSSCPLTAPQEVACSISVPAGNTILGGTRIDPSVEIETQPSPVIGGNNHMVINDLNNIYIDPVNQKL